MAGTLPCGGEFDFRFRLQDNIILQNFTTDLMFWIIWKQTYLSTMVYMTVMKYCKDCNGRPRIVFIWYQLLCVNNLTSGNWIAIIVSTPNKSVLFSDTHFLNVWTKAIPKSYTNWHLHATFESYTQFFKYSNNWKYNIQVLNIPHWKQMPLFL